MLLGGEAYNRHTLSRFFILHAAVLPVLMILLLVVHIGIIRLQGVTEFEFEDEPEPQAEHFNFFPDHMLTELIIGLVLMGSCRALATVCCPRPWGPQADPLTTPEVIKPEWFFYVAFRWLKLFSRNRRDPVASGSSSSSCSSGPSSTPGFASAPASPKRASGSASSASLTIIGSDRLGGRGRPLTGSRL